MALDSLPPINTHWTPPPAAAPATDDARRDAIEAELDEAFRELGVERGNGLDAALKPRLLVPMPPLTASVSGLRSDGKGKDVTTTTTKVDDQ
mmetsp:Transcript_10132/g.27581  ORF Transcript_10132/g.27581 Transcript_10132/m.27581 type:complete len:92 (+) Transcript_10132:104-379(+)